MTALVSVEGLSKSYRTGGGLLRAVDHVSFEIAGGETLAIVGESGSGKTTLALALLGIEPAENGTLAIDDETPRPMPKSVDKRLTHLVGVVFQNPHSSLNPRLRVRSIVGEPLRTSSSLRGAGLRDRVLQLLNEVGLGPEHLERYPHELSGGQLQRVAIARALALRPKLLVLDEPTSALDVSVQAQILKLLKSLQRETGVSYLVITHDLGAVDYVADRVMVMYLGRVVESGPTAEVFVDPRHPYTRALLDAVPRIDLSLRGRFRPLRGEIPSPVNRPAGCAFSPRCPMSSDRCRVEEPELRLAAGGRSFACHHPLPAAATGRASDDAA